METWKPIDFIDGLIPGYEVSSHGRVKSISGALLTPATTAYGYHVVCINNSGFKYTFRLHRLVAMAFLPNPNNKPQVNHIDGNKKNNRVSNLEWSTPLENMRHAITTGLKTAGRKPNRYGKPVQQFTKDGEFIEEFISTQVAQQRTGIGYSVISKCLTGANPSAGGYHWKYKE